MILKKITLAITGIVISSAISNSTLVYRQNIKVTDYKYNGETAPDFNKINSKDWDKWCEINSEYNRPDGKGYKNKYDANKADYNYGICTFSINSALGASDESIAQVTSGRITGGLILTSKGNVFDMSGNKIEAPSNTVAITNPKSAPNNFYSIAEARLFLTELGNVYSAGDGSMNGLGYDTDAPVEIPELKNKNVIAIASTGFYEEEESHQTYSDHFLMPNTNFALTTTGELYSWGVTAKGKSAWGGQLNAKHTSSIGTGAYYDQLKPASISNYGDLKGEKVRKIVASYESVYVLTYSGKIIGWGNNVFGLGQTTLPKVLTSSGIGTIVDLFASSDALYAKNEAGITYGRGLASQMGGIGDSSSWSELNWAKNFNKMNNGTTSPAIIDTNGKVLLVGGTVNQQLIENAINVYSNGNNSLILDSSGALYNANGAKIAEGAIPYITSDSGYTGANSLSSYKYIYTNDHPTKNAAINSSPIRMINLMTADYYRSSDYFVPSIGGRMCNEAEQCFDLEIIRVPNEDRNGPNYNDNNIDWNGGIDDRYELARIKPVAFSVVENLQSTISIPLVDGGYTNSNYVKVDKLGQIHESLIVLMEVFFTNDRGEEELIASQRYGNTGANLGNFVIEPAQYYEEQSRVIFKFRTYLDVEANINDEGLIELYSSARSFIHAPAPTTGKTSKFNVGLLITIIIIVVGGALVGGYFYIKSRRGPNRY